MTETKVNPQLVTDTFGNIYFAKCRYSNFFLRNRFIILGE